VHPGFDPRRLYTVEVSFPRGKDDRAIGAAAFMSELVDRARRIPGVTGVTTAGATPTQQQFMIGALEVEGQPAPAEGSASFVSSNGVEPGYFRFMGIPLVRGSTITDTTATSAQVVINEGAARKLMPGRDPLGQRIRVSFGGHGDWLTVVGVAADVRTAGLDRDPAEPILYLGPSAAFSRAMLVRTGDTGDTGDPIPTLRKLVASIDPNLPPARIGSVNSALDAGIAGRRFTMVLLTAFSLLALVLAMVGLYGVMSYAVAQRTREIGIRIALGATRRAIAQSVLRQGAVLSLVGVAIGLVAAGWATTLLQGSLHGVTRTDVPSFAVAAVALLATAIGACVVPMNRAVSVDPQIAMRAD
jgi:predicted permease